MPETPEPPEQPARIADIRRYRNSFVGMAMLACTPFLIFASVPVYGGWIAAGLFAAWLVLLFVGGASFMRAPNRVIVVAMLSWAIWVVVIALTR